MTSAELVEVKFLSPQWAMGIQSHDKTKQALAAQGGEGCCKTATPRDADFE
ncbi:MAG: hypothetical protein KF861_09540 [Planctomycetaceae bacterium]|nr:hypothetical protein [Planctomycetaceae bacterium]